jgi:hypothetical protein
MNEFDLYFKLLEDERLALDALEELSKAERKIEALRVEASQKCKFRPTKNEWHLSKQVEALKQEVNAIWVGRASRMCEELEGGSPFDHDTLVRMSQALKARGF